ncbi:amino acid adenylation domain-containing protein [Streptomyces roseoverticillatus]|uniref:Pls/PosA family non-ribosomal peptide synthetase n=1 Tax=Streptomyces roseoverticillatus TaxID=66429 RepID=UPI001F44CA2F|nr:Pls/PosA family non-ribosomal peptide synthetase [Streptomyces roseoverticillatus]MCF3104736.1 amino acid adenylation domain-containing protein [Streptomyces roseoverticillatus]
MVAHGERRDGEAPRRDPPWEGVPRSASRADGVLTCAGDDGSARWRDGERLECLFEERCDRLRAQGREDRLAVDAGDVTLTYAQLDDRANQLARFLLARGTRPGDRIGLLLDDAVDAYTGMLGVLKAHAVYVPLDAGFPADRLSYIVSDASVRTVLSLSRLADRVGHLATGADLLYLDRVRAEVAAQPRRRPGSADAGQQAGDLCYVIYTSGTTGRPKGVAIGHPAICNFVRVAAEVYGITGEDRVYQGMTLAFDFSVEETWVPWTAGATLVPRPAGPGLLGAELDAFLQERRVTALCCVPTLLATLDEERSGLRFLLVSGESCPQDLISRWHRPGRRFLNVYGPTEATVTATWTLLDPDRPVTIGVPLPTYAVVLLDPREDAALPPGAMGEIGIAGIGLAGGYLNRPDLTDRAFVPDFLGVPGNPSGRIYRTGDLGRVNPRGEIEHHGRIDTQVKIRGYRVEPAEIESVLLRVPGIAQAVVTRHEPAPGAVELCAFYTVREGAVVDPDDVVVRLRERLPAYMVPAYLEPVASIPVLPSGKADRSRLPAPSGPRRLAAQHAYTAPETGTERALAGLLAGVLQVERVSVDSHFFDELGANSLLMAHFNAAVRERPDLPGVSMKDVYLHPTVRDLAAVLDRTAPAAPDRVAGHVPAQRPAPPRAPEVSTPRYVLCAAMQLLVFLVYVCLGSVALDAGTTWVMQASGWEVVYGRAVAFAAAVLGGMALMPIAAKWILIGRWPARRIPLWSMAYVRFWCVKTLVVANPLVRLCVGTPLYPLYLRALGAKVGPRALILTLHVPVCTDLLTIGADSVIRKDTYLNGYRAHDGVVETGPVTIGDRAFAGEHSTLDIGARLGDGAQLGHASSLHSGQSVPAGQCWHGSPAVPAPAGCQYLTVPPARCGTLRRACHSIFRLLIAVTTVGAADVAVAALLESRPSLLARTVTGETGPDTWAYYANGLQISAATVFGLAIIGPVLITSLSRALCRLVRPGAVHPLYGVQFALQRAAARLTNIVFCNALFGDTSAVVHYLRALGYRLRPVEQTGSNFGMTLKHEVPTLSRIGTGTMVSDGLSLMNAEFSSTSFRVVPATIGRRNFLGNDIAYPAGGRTGDDCLLATKVMIPVSGPLKEATGLLGSPPFEIPRTVERDHGFDALGTGSERRRRLAAKNHHNAVTVALFLTVRCLYVFGLVLIAMLPLGDDEMLHWLETACSIVAGLVFTVVWFALVERAVIGPHGLRPRFCSIYDKAFWRHERYWKVPSTAYHAVFNGTPFKPAVWRLLGVRMGRRVFDDGCGIIERTLTRVGDGCALNAGSTLQAHSLEDGVFKSRRIAIGNGCTVGTSAFVHYGVVIDDGARIDADSFLMKGEHVPARTHWRGNPAAELPAG